MTGFNQQVPERRSSNNNLLGDPFCFDLSTNLQNMNLHTQHKARQVAQPDPGFFVEDQLPMSRSLVERRNSVRLLPIDL